MIKQQLFYIFRFNSTRLREYDYNIKITLDEARKNEEIISLGSSELIRKIKKDEEIHIETLLGLLEEKRKLSKNQTTKETIKQLKNLQNEIDSILFIPEIISITIDKSEHYSYLFENGVSINGKVYRRHECNSGQSRRKKVLFVEEKALYSIKSKLENGFDKNKEINPNKFNSYFGLYSSNSFPVRDVRFCIVKDLEIRFAKKVDFVHQEQDKIWVETVDQFPLTMKPHDGEGLITPYGAELWAQDMGITDYIPGYFGIRFSYTKGMVVTFPMEEFAEKIAGTYTFIDAWGDKRDSRDYDLFLTTSQVKTWNHYKSLEHFIKTCRKNKISWGVCRVSPEQDVHYRYTNYQYLQTLNMTDQDIQELCHPSIEWLKDISGADAIQTCLYHLGKGAHSVRSMEDIKDPVVKSILLNNKLVKDPYIEQKTKSSIKKRIQNTYCGKLLVESNYQTMIADPYSLAQNIFGYKPEECTGILDEGEHYSAYWNKKGVSKVDACRSPLTHFSEHNMLNLQDHATVNHWFRYQNSGIIYPTKGIDTIIHADSDYDLDLVFTTNNPVFLRCSYKGMLPITYKKKEAPKVLITDEALYEADLQAFKNEIGKVTNYSTDMYCMLAQFHQGSKTYNELLNRLKITRMLQGNAIDSAKGIEVESFPKEWIKYQRIISHDEYNEKGELINKADTQFEKHRKQFLNTLVAGKKPYFQGWLYPKYRKEYRDYIEKADLYCKVTFGLPLEAVKKQRPKSNAVKSFLKNHYKYMPLNIAPCIMNKLSWYMESACKDIIKPSENSDTHKIASILKDPTITKDETRFKKILKLYEKFKQQKKIHTKLESANHYKDKFDENTFSALQVFYREVRKEISLICANTAEAVNYAVEIVYELNPKDKKDFVWEVFEEDILVNVTKNKQAKVLLPILDPNGSIEYLGNKFRLQEVKT